MALLDLEPVLDAFVAKDITIHVKAPGTLDDKRVRKLLAEHKVTVNGRKEDRSRRF